MKCTPIVMTLAVFAVVVTISAGTAVGEPRKMIWPERLEPGDTIMFVGPAGPVERAQVEIAKRRIEERGYHVKMRDDLFAVDGYLAGSDERRAEELMEAFADPEVDAVAACRGGYGVMRILDKLDYNVIRAHPKVFIGYSDITALHAAISQHAGVVTFHGPGPASGLGSPREPTDFTARHLACAIAHQGATGPYEIEVPAGMAKVETLGAGKARGRLVGGNLSLISAVEGTPYAIDAEDAILLIEDVREAPYRIDRMLRQLKLAGKLDKLRGAVLGQFTQIDDREDQSTTDPRYSEAGVLRQYFADAGIPVLMNFPVGHTDDNCTLPIGGEVEIDADRGTLRVLAP